MLKKGIGLFLVSLLAFNLAACGKTETSAPAEQAKAQTEQKSETKEESSEKKEQGPAEFASAYQTIVDEMSKAANGEKVDFALVEKTYVEQIKPVVEKRDSEFNDQVAVQLDSALTAGKDGSLDANVVKQVFDKLLQKVAFQSIRHEFKEVEENWDNKETVLAEIQEAKEFYEPIVKPMMEKRDNANQTQLVSIIGGAFNDMDKAVEAKDQLSYKLAKQVIDKTIMKGFYLAAGSNPNGYAYKIEKTAKEDPAKAKIQQAEGWAFYQALNSYVEGSSAEDAKYINSQFDLTTDAAAIDADLINQAFVRGFAKVALHEYAEIAENWGQDKAAVVALEGALFIQVIESDIKSSLGEPAFNELVEKAGQLLEDVKAGNKEGADAKLAEIKPVLEQLAKVGK